MKLDDNMTEIFDLAPTEYSEIVQKKNDIVVTNDKDTIVNNDFGNVRENLYDLIETGRDALLDMLEVAKQSEHPRAYEVVGNLMKQLADMNQQLLDIHQQKQKLEPPIKAETTSVTNNAIFVGSTNDLAKMISDMHKGE